MRIISANNINNFLFFGFFFSLTCDYDLLQNMVNNLITVGSGQEAAFAAALLGDNALMEKAWQETGMLAEAVLHAHV